jgi:cell division protein FtsW
MVLSSASNKIYLVLTCSALIFQFCLQALVHMASTLNLIPTKGMTLPFISYGGSSLIASSITMGIVLAMTRRQTIKDYE